ncbi:hypothetical protein LJR219_003894 [Phenylobacterium sp. LjRoot219]|uniref:hypothetical protein n=1 Tax=Phenylobacterium sp. LjRoot219 TaxID=3342283 RepID=UPI003ECF8B54
MRWAGQAAFCTCFYLAVYVGLGSRAWHYGLSISDPLTDFLFAAASLGAVFVFGARVGSPALVLVCAVFAGIIQKVADRFWWWSPGWPEAVYLMTSLSILCLSLGFAGREQDRPAVNASSILIVGIAIKALTRVRADLFGHGNLYPLQFMLTWGLILFGFIMLAGEGARTITRKTRALSTR